jgi:hypothetical protein
LPSTSMVNTEPEKTVIDLTVNAASVSFGGAMTRLDIQVSPEPCKTA